MTPDEMTALAQIIENREVGEIDLAGNQTGGRASLGHLVAQASAKHQEVMATVKGVAVPAVDVAALAAALAADPNFARAIAAAVVAQIGTDLAPTAVHPIGTPTPATA